MRMTWKLAIGVAALAAAAGGARAQTAAYTMPRWSQPTASPAAAPVEVVTPVAASIAAMQEAGPTCGPTCGGCTACGRRKKHDCLHRLCAWLSYRPARTRWCARTARARALRVRPDRSDPRGHQQKWPVRHHRPGPPRPSECEALRWALSKRRDDQVDRLFGGAALHLDAQEAVAVLTADPRQRQSSSGRSTVSRPRSAWMRSTCDVAIS